MKIIDWELKGNVARFYLGDDGLENWYGDDWDDAPYEHNAGSVYSEYVTAVMDVAFPFDAEVSEPCDDYCNSPYCKNDFKQGDEPIITVEFSDRPVARFFMGQLFDDDDARIGTCSIWDEHDSDADAAANGIQNRDFREYLSDEARIMANVSRSLLKRVVGRNANEIFGEAEAVDRILAYAFDAAEDIEDFYSIIDNLGTRFGLEDSDLEWLGKQLGL